MRFVEPRLDTSPFLINTLKIAVVRVQILTDHLYFTNNIFLYLLHVEFLNMWIVNISGQLKNSTFIATIHLKGLLIRKGYLENLDYRIRNTLNKTKISIAKLSSHKFNILMKFSHEQCSSSTI